MELQRRLTVAHATALNVIDMVGIGPFIVMSSVMAAMGGPHAVLAWIIGALLAYADAMVWAELGAAFPEAGGSYAFLRVLYGPARLGRVMAFLFIWQTVFQSSFVVASGAIGFTNYVQYLLPLSGGWERKAVAAAVIVLIVAALYRRIETIGNISLGLGVVVIGTLVWVIVAGVVGGDWSFLGDIPRSIGRLGGLGEAMQSTVYAILGYYNVCHLGAEVVEPEKTIPRSMFLSIAIVTTLYVAMQLSVESLVGWKEARPDQFIVSIAIERVWGQSAAVIATILVLIVALSSLYSVVLGYSRIPYAAARDGNFFRFFARLHPTKNFPHVSLLAIGGISVVLVLLFDGLRMVVASILTLRILVQFIGQAVGLLLYHRRNPHARFPFRMAFYPLPAIVAIGLWVWLFVVRPPAAIATGLGVLAAGVVVYLLVARLNGWFPFDGRAGRSPMSDLQ
ncbi:MAG: amino acid permease [Candidatus Kapaibacterium sp.]|nr:MAG: amino acid permease [Candidatus Kapabacteria bacterium]